MTVAVTCLKKTLATIEHRLEEHKSTQRYHEEQIDISRERVVEYGKQADALKTAIALLEKAS